MAMLVYDDAGNLTPVRSTMWSLNAQAWPLSTLSNSAVTDFGGSSTPLAIYESQRSVRTVVKFLARAAAQLRLQGFDRADEGMDRQRLGKTHPIEALLRKPDSASVPFRYVYDLVTDICLYDRWAAGKTRDAMGKYQLLRLPPYLWKFERDVLNRPIAIRLMGTVGDLPANMLLPLDQFVWMDGYPDSCQSPMAAIADLLEEEREAAAFRTGLWRNGGRISGWISRPANAPSEGWNRDKFGASWRSNYGGASATRGGGTPLLEDGMEYHELTGVTPRAAQAVESRKLSLAEVASLYGVSPVLVGILDNANFSNVMAFRQQVYVDTLGSMLNHIQDAHNAHLCEDSEFTVTGNEYVEFNVMEKLRLSFEERAVAISTAVGGPWLTRAEARASDNKPYLPGTDELIVPLNVITGGQASPQDSAPPPKGDLGYGPPIVVARDDDDDDD